MTADVLRRGVQHHVEAQADRSAQGGRRERVVDGGEDPRVAAQLGEHRQIRDRGRGIHDRLAVEEVGAGEGVTDLVDVRGVHERRLDPEARKDVLQHRHRASVERGARHDPRTRARDGQQEGRDGRHPGGESDRGLRVFEICHRGLERVDGGVPVPARVHVARTVESDRARELLVRLEPERRGLEDRHAARRLLGHRGPMGMHGARLESAPFPRVAHGGQPTSSIAVGSGLGDRRRAG